MTSETNTNEVGIELVELTEMVAGTSSEDCLVTNCYLVLPLVVPTQ